MTQTATAVLKVTRAIRDVFRAELPDKFDLYIGPPTGGDIPSEYAAVAYGGADRPDIVTRPEIPQWGNRTDQHAEDMDVWCCISVAMGDADGEAALEKVSTYVNTVELELKKDPSLRGTLDAGGYATVGAHDWLIDERGLIGTCFFQVNVHLPFVD